MLALCHDLKADDYAQNYAGIIFLSLLLLDAVRYLHFEVKMIDVYAFMDGINILS